MSSRQPPVSLAVGRPELADQWDQALNGTLTPGDVTTGTNRVVWWRGPCGHVWDMAVKYRTGRQRSGCPFCAGKRVLPGESFAALFPELAAEWHPTANGARRPESVSPGSDHRVRWQCGTCPHEWVTTVVHRTREKTGCPACAGKVVVAGRSLADLLPDVAAEWAPGRNGALLPTAVLPFSAKRVWWRCGHCTNEWEATVAKRSGGRGCPTCRPVGVSRVAVQIGAELATLLPVGDLERAPREVRAAVGWEPDIVLAGRKIAIDVDGRFWHGEDHAKSRGSTARDLRKLQVFTDAGWTLVRVREAPLTLLGPHDVVVEDLRATRAVVITLVEHLTATLGVPAPALEDYRTRSGLAAGDQADALMRRYQTRRVAGRTLTELNPAVAGEWHPTRNGALRPDAVYASSPRRVWWRCAAAGHEWDATLLNRSQGSGCPLCSGHRAGQGNTLADLRPDLAAEWDVAGNGDLRPDQVTPGTSRKARWRCHAGHGWEASIASRNAGRGCPFCAGRRASPKWNLLVVCPDVARQWHPTRNGELTPAQVTPGSHYNAFWQCEDGHAWQATVESRRQLTRCPYCTGRAAGQGNTLADLHPALAAQWHPTRNGTLSTADVTASTSAPAWWQCTPTQHYWNARIADRITNPQCPFCSGTVAGQGNTLADLHPELASQWHPDGNGAVHATDVVPASPRVTRWRCAANHEWRGAVCDRVAGAGCPVCAGHQPAPRGKLTDERPDLAAQWHQTRNPDPTPGDLTCGSDRNAWWSCAPGGHEWEAAVSARVRGTGCPICSGKQAGQGNTLQDLYPELAAQWHTTLNGARTAASVTTGSKERVAWQCEVGHDWRASVSSRTRQGTGCPACSGRSATPQVNLTVTHPELAAQWHPVRNGDLRPDQVLAGSAKKLWWQCTSGHEWQAVVANRSRLHSPCPKCSGRHPTPERNLATLFPAIAAQWDLTANDGLRPQEVTPGSGQRVGWRCHLDHTWRAVIGSRTGSAQAGCPMCANDRRRGPRGRTTTGPAPS